MHNKSVMVSRVKIACKRCFRTNEHEKVQIFLLDTHKRNSQLMQPVSYIICVCVLSKIAMNDVNEGKLRIRKTISWKSSTKDTYCNPTDKLFGSSKLHIQNIFGFVVGNPNIFHMKGGVFE